MMDIKYYESQIELTQSRIKELETSMERAGVGSEGDILNKIDKEKRNLRYYTAELETTKKCKTPAQVKIFFYIIVSTKEKVEKNVGPNLFLHFEEDRYHSTHYSEWKPFRGDSNIEGLIADVKKNYSVEPIYLDGEIDHEHWINIDDNIENSISIIDLFSLSTCKELINNILKN